MNQQNISSKEFYELVVSSDTSTVNEISASLIERISQYLKIVMRADKETAEDCAQQAFEKVYAKILNNTLSDISDLYSYLIRSAKNEYLMLLRRDKFEVHGEHKYFQEVPGSNADEVVQALYSEQKEKLLKVCIDKLSQKRKSFYVQVLKYINEKDAVTADKLNISHGSFRTKKSRLIDALRKCVKNALLD